MTILGGKVHTHVRYCRGRAGFTLIELLIVVAILAILAAILIPNFLRARASSQLATCQLDLRNIAAALELFYGQNQTYPLAVSWQNDLVTGGYFCALTKTPHDHCEKGYATDTGRSAVLYVGGPAKIIHARLTRPLHYTVTSGM